MCDLYCFPDRFEDDNEALCTVVEKKVSCLSSMKECLKVHHESVRSPHYIQETKTLSTILYYTTSNEESKSSCSDDLLLLDKQDNMDNMDTFRTPEGELIGKVLHIEKAVEEASTIFTQTLMKKPRISCKLSNSIYSRRNESRETFNQDSLKEIFQEEKKGEDKDIFTGDKVVNSSGRKKNCNDNVTNAIDSYFSSVAERQQKAYDSHNERMKFSQPNAIFVARASSVPSRLVRLFPGINKSSSLALLLCSEKELNSTDNMVKINYASFDPHVSNSWSATRNKSYSSTSTTRKSDKCFIRLYKHADKKIIAGKHRRKGIQMKSEARNQKYEPSSQKISVKDAERLYYDGLKQMLILNEKISSGTMSTSKKYHFDEKLKEKVMNG